MANVSDAFERGRLRYERIVGETRATVGRGGLQHARMRASKASGSSRSDGGNHA